MRPFLAALVGLLLAGCSPLALLNAAVPHGPYELHDGIAYGELPRQRLDVYVPAGTAPAKGRPVIVFFYGGGWQSGERGEHRFVGEAFTARGFVVVVPDYRVYPDAAYPAFMHDAAGALAWTKREIPRFGGDPKHVVVMGHSAGAHIAAMLAYNERFTREAGAGQDPIRAIIGLAGPYDFHPEEPAIAAALSGEGDAALAMPTRYVKPGAPRALLLIGDADRRVAVSNQEKLARRLRETGNEVDARVLPGYGHPGILVRLSKPLRDEALVGTIAAFAAR